FEIDAFQNLLSVLLYDEVFVGRAFNLERLSAVKRCCRSERNTRVSLIPDLRSQCVPLILRDWKGPVRLEQFTRLVTKKQTTCNGQPAAHKHVGITPLTAERTQTTTVNFALKAVHSSFAESNRKPHAGIQ